MGAPDFLHREPRALGKRVHRLGLATSHGLDQDGMRAAIDAGVNYLFYTRGSFAPVIREAIRRDRERYVVASGPVLGYFGFTVRRGVEKALRTLGTDYLDVCHLFWAGKMSALGPGTFGELLRLKEEGKIRAIGTSIHDRKRAGRLAEDSPIDLFMLRYNAAHPGAERDVFPHLARRSPAVVAYTATAWRKLLRTPRGWTGPMPSAGDCYRFCLSSPHVDVVLTSPANRTQLEENLRALEKGPLSPDEMTAMRAFGAAVHG